MNHLDSREVRGRILRIMDLARPYRVTEETIWYALLDAKVQISQSAIPREMDYLRGKGYIESESIEDRTFGTVWSHKLASKGVDLIERRLPEDPGVRIFA